MTEQTILTHLIKIMRGAKGLDLPRKPETDEAARMYVWLADQRNCLNSDWVSDFRESEFGGLSLRFTKDQDKAMALAVDELTVEFGLALAEWESVPPISLVLDDEPALHIDPKTQSWDAFSHRRYDRFGSLLTV